MKPHAILGPGCAVACTAVLIIAAGQADEAVSSFACALPAEGHAPPGGVAAGAAATGSFGGLFDASDFPPRWRCGNWSSALGWVHIVSDLAIWGAYMSIPLALFFLVRKRPDVPFTGIFWLFMAFIAACGSGHLIEAGMFWWPVYRLSGLVKLFTAVVSWVTVLALLPIIPKALSLPALPAVNERLRREVAERAEAERLARARAQELEDAYQTFLGREQRIIELKQEVNALARAAGKPLPYDLDFVPDRGGSEA